MNKDDKINIQLHSGNPQGRSRRKLDYYPTPPNVTRALMDFLQLEPMVIWECACGDLSMSKVLESYGHTVISTDIEKGVDFLTSTRVSDAIITNPPFNKSADFIQKAVNEVDIVAMLLKSQYWHAKKRYDLFMSNPPTYVLPLTWRPDFLWQERKDGERSAPTMEVCWTVWINGDSITKYIPLKRGR